MNPKQKKLLTRIIVALVLFVAIEVATQTGILRAAFGTPGDVYAEFALFLIPYLIAGYDVIAGALRGLAHGHALDEDFLMTVATFGAFALVLFPDTEPHMAEGAAVMLFFQVGELFQSYAVDKSRQSIADMMDIAPEYANVMEEGKLKQIDPFELAPDDEFIVMPGERIPLDGTVLTGTSALNMSALTGESAPVDVAEGSTVVSGSVNLSGVLRLRVEKVYAESTVARILELVENSSLKKAHTERFITKFARVYTPSVCGAALALAILPPVVRLIMGIPAEWGDWIYRALTFLVISCPCALVISIPLSFFGGIGGASARGILIKGSSYLEMLAKTDRVVFDKTGTLTRAEAAKLLYELMTAQAHKQYDRSDNGFSDVPAGKWYVVAVSTLANAGAIKGYSNGTFQPGKPITRAEFVTILTGIYGANTSKGMPFADVGSAWCHDAVATAYANGWVGGYADGTFHPNQTITRAEAVTILNRVLGRSCDLTFVQANAQAASHFTDVTPGAWYYAAVTEASVGHTFTELTGIERWTALA